MWSTIQTGTRSPPTWSRTSRLRTPELVTVQKPSGDSNVVRATYSTAFAAGASTPDIYSEDQTWPGEATQNHWDVNLNKLVPKSYLKDITPGLLQVTHTRRTHSGPYFTDSIILYYRKDLLAKAHLTPPTTWTQLVSEAKQLQSSKLAKYGLIYFGANFEGTTMFWTSMVADAGGATMNPGDTAATVNSHPGLEALNFLHSTISSGITPHAVATFGAATPGQVFDEGQTGFMVCNEYQWPGVKAANMTSKVGVSAIPTFPGGPASGPAATGGSLTTSTPTPSTYKPT